MISFIKKLILYKYRFPFLINSTLYQWWKKAYAKIASLLYNNPTKGMFVIGVTGTDGKTTTTNLIHHILQENVGKTALISTAVIKIGNEVIPNTYKMTSLDPFQLRKILQVVKESGCTHLVLEVASHAIHQHRFDGIEFDMAVLTNITPEHLDYHKTMDAYADVKKQLFMQVMKNSKAMKLAVLPKDDDYGRKRCDELYFDKMLTYSINTSSMLRGENINLGMNHTTFSFNYLGKATDITMELPGSYNVLNALAAIASGLKSVSIKKKSLHHLQHSKVLSDVWSHSPTRAHNTLSTLPIHQMH
jgi:UDP-N-acetylmuramoyl-L-alanyl-D-glutamate--2,6-diaminopimelate ligase